MILALPLRGKLLVDPVAAASLRLRVRLCRVAGAPAAVRPARRPGPFVALVALAASWIAVSWIGGLPGAEAGGPSAQRVGAAVEFPRAELFIDTPRGTHRFEVEVARTNVKRARGLMFRIRLAADAGMLFVYERRGPVVMWMKNTLISLDMLFIAAEGRIVRIAANTTPLSEKMISSGSPVRAVLELPAGTAARLGIAPGDRVRSDALPAAP